MRAQKCRNIMMKNLTDCCFGVISYWVIGWALMFHLGSGEFTANVAKGWFSGTKVSSEILRLCSSKLLLPPRHRQLYLAPSASAQD